MKVESFVQILGSDFYTGVPDSQLKALCNYLMNTYGIDPKHHVIGANEGNCAALAAGYHLATGKVPVVYMQNSGEGNIINPAASLLNDKVYGIPVIFVVGWRGEPGIHDEPQHIYQGEEIGMTNTDFTDISQFRDVESLNHYEILQQKGLSKEDAFRIIQIHSRDNGRTPMQWNGENHGGFTKGMPWIGVNKNYSKINAQSQLHDETSIFNYYKKLVALRKELDIIAYGDIRPLDVRHPSIIAYERIYGEEKMLVVCNFYKTEVVWDSGMDLKGFETLLGNYSEQKIEESKISLKPYEAMMLYRKR